MASLSERLDYLIGGLNLDPVALPTAQDRAAWLAAHPVAVLVSDSEPDAHWLQAAKAAGVPLLVLEPMAADPLGALETMSTRLIEGLRR